jgi:chaperonin cofactor prefoldin
MWCLVGLGEAPNRDVLGRLEALEDDMQRMLRRFDKLQGEFNASLRAQRQLERENDSLNDEIEALQNGE